MGRADKTLKEIIQSLTTYSERIQVLDKQRTSPGIRSSQLQSLNLQLRNAKRRLYELRKEVETKVKGEIIIVTCEVDGILSYGRFVNLSNEEIEYLYHHLSLWSCKDIKILDIKRLPTYFLNSKDPRI